MSDGFMQAIAAVMQPQPLKEARRPDVAYTEKKTKGEVVRVLATLEDNQSGVLTRLSKPYKDLKDMLETLEAEKDKLNDQVRDAAEELFDVQDQLYTRVVETVSMTITLSKKSEASEKTETDYEAVVKQLLEMVPELTTKVDELVKANSKVVKVAAKKVGVRVDFNESWAGELVARIKTMVVSLVARFTKWATSYDQKLANVRKQIAAL